MTNQTLKELVIQNLEIVKQLEQNDKYIVLSLDNPLPISKLADTKSDVIIEGLGNDIFASLIKNSFFAENDYAVLIDLSKFVVLYNGLTGENENERIYSAIKMARVNFMGTDGIRGKVVTDIKKNFISDLLLDNAFTPQLVETTSYAFAKMIMKNNIIKEGDTVVIGNDGRDKAYNWILNNSVRKGFTRAGVSILDAGVVPTAIVPYLMLKKDYRAGAVLTASHNPANQNGIKFFIDGKKLVPEGENGDYVLSAYMYKYCFIENMENKSGNIDEIKGIEDESVDFIYSILPQNTDELLKDIILVFDSANGSTHTIGKKLLDKIGVNYVCKNEEPEGSNINRSCGVAEIEGTEYYSGKDYSTFVPFIKEIFDKGRNQDKPVFGIAVDGDGDRGFLLVYDKKDDSVHVLDGDKCGYILAKFFIKTKNLNPSDYWFISTIESDIMTATSAEKNLGLNKKIVSVGDKWIGNFSGGKVLVGLEISGHLIFPVNVKSEKGEDKEMLSGIGILTGLISLVAVRDMNLSVEEMVEPFEPGFSKTFYTFFIDKTKFYKNSSIWNSDYKILSTEFEVLKSNGEVKESITISVEEKEDPNVLYVNFVENNDVVGCIFIRNSGTEDKNAVYVKGKKDLEESFVKIGKKLQQYHFEQLKNENRVEYKYEKFILNKLETLKEVDFDTIKSEIEKQEGITILESDLFSVIYGLKKEGRVTLEDKTIKLL